MRVNSIFVCCVLGIAGCALRGMEYELNELRQKGNSQHEKQQITEKSSLISTSHKKTNICLDNKKLICRLCCLAGTAAGAFSGMGCLYYLAFFQHCKINASLYPSCGGTTDFVDSEFAALANFWGNIEDTGVAWPSKNILYYRYSDRYCDYPLHQICTNFDSSKVENCTIENGTLLGVVSGSDYRDPYQPESIVLINNNCLVNVTDKIEKKFKKTGVRYCKITPNKANIQWYNSLLLTLYLIDRNVTLPFVTSKRWSNPGHFADLTWYEQDGVHKYHIPCDVRWSSNVDPSAQLHKTQTKQIHYTQMVMNRTKLLNRYNKTVKKKVTSTFGKMTSHR